MNRNESFPAILVSKLEANLAWASLEVTVEDVEQIQVLVSGAEADVKDLRILCEENRLTVEQPTYGINIKNLGSERWMQILVRLPRSWKGAIDLSTFSAPLKVRGVTGTDLELDTVSGDLTATDLTSITTVLHTVSGHLRTENISGERVSLASVSGDITASRCCYDHYRINTVSGCADVEMLRPFSKLDGHSVSGSMRLFAPMTEADAALRSVSGRLLTRGVSIVPGAAPARVATVSGDLELNSSLTAGLEAE